MTQNALKSATKNDPLYLTLIVGGSLIISALPLFGGSLLIEANNGSLLNGFGYGLASLGWAWVAGTVAMAGFIGLQMRNNHLRAVRVEA